MDASESARMRRLDGGRGREERCDIPVARRAETGALLVATFMDVKEKIISSPILF